ncbi:MAG: prephenate dehydrogenase/arogenate dehydrogenase family protein [SAR116 cluster bacterium]|nr:cyclohexadienyl dehydrogenase [Paracoccaceae bacterium]RCL79327.1 MAG: prephenate dehydrogenase/arogenate dehydrogenase family protein [SAR116 cluster bacterium]HBQ23437.1 prephenate/arogenate dehydrogenase family protein [Alphaproteobacteria bacterium]|tara:strand:+ start:992 stop:1852 length:861 start_codon:yes stop_codon:yes gene_type:complete
MKTLIIGAGLIGSSLARALKQAGGYDIILHDANDDVRSKAKQLGLGHVVNQLAEGLDGADIVVLATPVGTYEGLVKEINEHGPDGLVVTDVGSVKSMVAKEFATLRQGLHGVPAHPIAGTEKSGPEHGFASLFAQRWSIITPLENGDEGAQKIVTKLWEDVGARVELMTPDRHDLVMAITSHIPHLVAFSTVGTANHLEQVTSSEVIKYSAGGFDSFTRLAGSDPVMWRDVFLNNREAVMEMLGRFIEDLVTVQRMIRYGDGEAMEELFGQTRAIRKQLIDSGMGR